MSESIERIALALVEALAGITRLTDEVKMLRKEVLTLRDTCRGCAGFQDSGQ